MPPTCSICFEPFTSPVSLPCGHVFCQECIRRTVDAVKSCSPQHVCPTCRRPYSIITIDPALVPPYLRPHIHPSVRQVFIDASTSSPVASTSAGPSSPAAPASSSPSTSASSSPSASASDAALARAHAELEALKASCATWRRRAEIHAAANGSLLSFARAARDCALRLRSERDAARSRCTLLKRTLSETLPQSTLGPLALSPASDAADAAADTAHARSEVARGVGGACGLPVYLMQMQGRPAAHYYDNPRDMEESHFGPPLKRRKIADTDSDSSATPSSSPSSSVSAASPPRDAPAPAPKPTPARTQASPSRTRNRHRPQPRVITPTPVSDAPLSASGPHPSPAVPVPVGPFLGSLF